MGSIGIRMDPSGRERLLIEIVFKAKSFQIFTYTPPVF